MRARTADAQDVIDLCDDLTDASNIHPGLQLIADGLTAITEDPDLDLSATALLLAQLVGAADTNVITAIGSVIAHLTSPANPALDNLKDDQAKEINRLGHLARLDLQDPDLARNTSEALTHFHH
jgi:hypothetical protein